MWKFSEDADLRKVFIPYFPSFIWGNADWKRAFFYIHFYIHFFLQNNRSSRPEVFCKKGVLRNFTKFTGKHLCQNLFFNKGAGLRPEFCEISKSTFSYRTPPAVAPKTSTTHSQISLLEPVQLAPVGVACALPFAVSFWQL